MEDLVAGQALKIKVIRMMQFFAACIHLCLTALLIPSQFLKDQEVEDYLEALKMMVEQVVEPFGYNREI